MVSENEETRQRIRDYLWREEGSERGTGLQAIKDIAKVGNYHDLEVWKTRLIFADHEKWVWVIPEPVLNYYIHRGWVSDQQTEFGNPEEAATFHTCTERSRSIGLMMVLRERQRQRRLDEFKPREVQAARGSSGETCAERSRSIIRAGKNTKVSVLAKRVMDQFFVQGFVELETVGPGAVNQAVKAVARARQALEPEGYSLAPS